jgi:hypothetical protein
MRVSFNGKTYKVQVQPGPEGAAAFERQIRSLLQLPETIEFDVIFHCRAPGTGASRGQRLPGVCMKGRGGLTAAPLRGVFRANAAAVLLILAPGILLCVVYILQMLLWVFCWLCATCACVGRIWRASDRRSGLQRVS